MYFRNDVKGTIKEHAILYLLNNVVSDDFERPWNLATASILEKLLHDIIIPDGKLHWNDHKFCIRTASNDWLYIDNRLRSMNVLYVIDDVAVCMRSNRLQLNPKIRPRSSGPPRVAVSVNCPNHTPLRVGFDYVAPVFVTLGSISIRTSTWGHAFLRLFRPVSRYYSSFTVSVGYTRQIRSPVTDVITPPRHD